MATMIPPVSHPGSISLENEKNPWLAAANRFDEAAARLKLDDGMRKVLGSPARELTVHIPVQLDDGRLEVFTGYRVQHSVARGPAKGGIRFAPDVTLDEVRALAVHARQRGKHAKSHQDLPPESPDVFSKNHQGQAHRSTHFL